MRLLCDLQSDAILSKTSKRKIVKVQGLLLPAQGTQLSHTSLASDIFSHANASQVKFLLLNISGKSMLTADTKRNPRRSLLMSCGELAAT